MKGLLKAIYSEITFNPRTGSFAACQGVAFSKSIKKALSKAKELAHNQPGAEYSPEMIVTTVQQTNGKLIMERVS